MSITGFLLRTDGTAETVEVAEASGSHLASMRAYVGAQLVDVIAADGTYGSIDAWVDDEGALTGIPNVAATVIMSELVGWALSPIFGNALLLSRDGEDAVGLSGRQLEDLRSIHSTLRKMPKLQDEIARAVIFGLRSGRS